MDRARSLHPWSIGGGGACRQSLRSRRMRRHTLGEVEVHLLVDHAWRLRCRAEGCVPSRGIKSRRSGIAVDTGIRTAWALFPYNERLRACLRVRVGAATMRHVLGRMHERSPLAEASRFQADHRKLGRTGGSWTLAVLPRNSTSARPALHRFCVRRDPQPLRARSRW